MCFRSFVVPFSKIASFKATTCLEIVWLCPKKLTRKIAKFRWHTVKLVYPINIINFFMAFDT